MGDRPGLNIVNYMNQALGVGTPHNTSRGMQYSYACPFCDDHKERMFVNLAKQVFYCHNCEAKGSIVTFISDYSHIPWNDALEVYRSYEGYDRELPDSLEEEIYEKLNNIPVIQGVKHRYPLPKEFISIENARGKAGIEAIKYLKRRGVTLDMALDNGIGYCDEGDYKNRIIMPDYENGELIFWQGRTWLPQPKDYIGKKFYRKVLNPTLTKEQKEQGMIAIDKSDVISNIDGILRESMAVICEGRFDAYSIGDIGGCIHGKHMSDVQFMKLVVNKSKIDTIAVMLDPDAMKNAISLSKRLYKHFDDVLVCRLPDGKDPNDIGRREIIKVINNAVPYTPMFEVKARLRGWI